MSSKSLNSKLFVIKIIFITLATFFMVHPAMGQGGKTLFEIPNDLRASAILSPDLMRGPNHKVEEEVATYDGFTNHFNISSPFGTFNAAGNSMVPVRIHEINVIARLAEVKKSQAFADALVEAGKSEIESARNLILHPVDTVSGYPTGLYNIIADFGVGVKGFMSSGDVRGAADSSIKTVTGFLKNKRNLAYDLGVNVYSDNKVLQSSLNSVAWAMTVGSFSVDVGKIAVAGPAGVVLTVNASNQTLGDMQRDTTLIGLIRMSQEKLEQSGIKESAIDRFLSHPVFSPRHKETIARSLASLTQAKGREVYLNLATANTRTVEDAFIFQVIAEMLAAYNKEKASIAEIRLVQNVVTFRDTNGVVGVTYPADNLYWTRRTAALAKNVAESVPDATRKEMWITGSVTPMSASNMEQMGWTVRTNSFRP